MAAARLGVTSSTLRSWERRYGVGPSLRTPGGHRRYSESDVARLDQVQRDMRAGMAPAAAAAAALAAGEAAAGDDSTQVHRPRIDVGRERRRGAGPGGRVLAVPGADGVTRGLARAAAQLDLDGAESLILEGLRHRGVLRTWDEMMRPVLVAVGRRWADSGEAIEVEHVLSEAALGALRRRRLELPVADDRRPVLVAAAPLDQHTLTLHVLTLGLAERRMPAVVLGAQVPVPALAAAVRRIRPSAVFVASVVEGSGDPEELAAHLPDTRPPTLVVVGGDGWPERLPARLHRPASLSEALDLLAGPADQL